MPTSPLILQLIERNRSQRSKILDLNRQHLLEVPPEVFTLVHLEELWLENNAIQVVPAELGQMPCLKIIDLRINPLKTIADVPGLVLDWDTWQRNRDMLRAENIAGLWLRWHSDELIDELRGLPNLRWLDLSYNWLTALPEKIKTLKNLSFLDLTNNRLTEIPKYFIELNKLTSLKLGGNKLIEIPEFVTGLQNLELLELCFNRFNAFPETITRLPNLETLNLDGNPLGEIPASIICLKNLRSLSLCSPRVQTRLCPAL